MKRALYVFAQCTWGLLQTLAGFFVFLANLRCPHSIYRGCINTRWKGRGGMSLGLFIFTPAEESSRSRAVLVHEYGHTIQSIILGPLYLFVVGIVSFCWAGLPCLRRMRIKKNIRYTALFAEAWASRLGERFTGDAAIWN